MAVSDLEIRAREPYAGGAAFGAAGAYEQLNGVVHVAIVPDHPANRAIADLDRATRNAAGQVTFEADFCILQPVDPTRGNGRALIEAPNNGRKILPRMLNHAAADASPEPIAPGDGFLLDAGWTLAWCGWQWDLVRGGALMGVTAPPALETAPNGTAREIAGRVLFQFQPNAWCADHPIGDRIPVPYPAAGDNADAILLVSEWPDGPRTTIPRTQWRFAQASAGGPVPDAAHIWLTDGFVAGRSYEVIYRTERSPVTGVGLLGLRDFTSFLRAGDRAANPCAGRIAHTFGYGMSQSGRLLRHFLFLGLNSDEAGRQVFDGLLVQVAGGRRGEFSHRYSQPSQQQARSFSMPFTDERETDPVTGTSDGLLVRQRALGNVPNVFYVNSSAEYWRGDGSLMHTDLAATRDVEPPAETRIYHFAGTQHGLGVVPLERVSMSGARGAHGFNAVDYAPLLRAALVNLERWVALGELPPPSQFPRLADGTAVPARVALDGCRAIPGITIPDADRLPAIPRVDLGPDAARGNDRYPPVIGAAYPSLVPAVDANGNEVAGIRPPDVAVPLATYTGWNPRDPATGGVGQIIQLQGSTLPFARSVEERSQRNDPRPSTGERYAGRAEYLARIRAAAEALIAQRFVRAEDLPLVLHLAAERYDTFIAAPAPTV